MPARSEAVRIANDALRRAGVELMLAGLSPTMDDARGRITEAALILREEALRHAAAAPLLNRLSEFLGRFQADISRQHRDG